MTRQDDLPPGLCEFGNRMQEAAHQEIQQEQQLRRRRRFPRLLVAVSVGTLTVGAVAGASSLILRDGSPIKSDPITPDKQLPPADPSVVASSAVADPDGGPPWALKVFENGAGELCVRVGRLRQGVLGQVRGTTFRPLPAEAPGVCGRLQTEKVVFSIERRGGPQPRTLVYGVTVGREPLVISLGVLSRRVTPGTLGTFLLVSRGAAAPKNAALSTKIGGVPFRRRLG